MVQPRSRSRTSTRRAVALWILALGSSLAFADATLGAPIQAFVGAVPNHLVPSWKGALPSGQASASGMNAVYAEAWNRRPDEIIDQRSQVNGVLRFDERTKFRNEVVPIWRAQERVLTRPGVTAAEKDAAIKTLLASESRLRPFEGGFQRAPKGVGMLGGQPFAPPESYVGAGMVPGAIGGVGGIGGIASCDGQNLACAQARASQSIARNFGGAIQGGGGWQTQVTLHPWASVSRGERHSTLAIAYSIDPLDITWEAAPASFDFSLDAAFSIEVSGDLPGFAASNLRATYVNNPMSDDPFEDQRDGATLLLDIGILVTTDGSGPELHVLVDAPGNPSAASAFESFIEAHLVDDGTGRFSFDAAPPLLQLAVDRTIGVGPSDPPATTTRFFLDESAGVVSSVPEAGATLLVATGALVLLGRHGRAVAAFQAVLRGGATAR